MSLACNHIFVWNIRLEPGCDVRAPQRRCWGKPLVNPIIHLHLHSHSHTHTHTYIYIYTIILTPTSKYEGNAHPHQAEPDLRTLPLDNCDS